MQISVMIHADYEEFKPETLRGFEVIQYDGSREVGSTTFPSLEDAESHARSLGSAYAFLSSVDNFMQDLRQMRLNS